MENTMQYLILIYGQEYPAPGPQDPGFDAYMAPWLAYNQRLIDGGHLLSAAQLHPALTATTIRRAFGAGDTVTDGPFAETKEQIGGFYLVRASDLDQVLELAAGLPVPAGSFEVRPIKLAPTA